MNEKARTDAQRADEIRAFQRELERLETQGVLQLTAEQRAALTSHHEAALEPLVGALVRRSTAVRMASSAGALALGAIAYFLYEAYWTSLSPEVQSVVLIGASITSLLAAFWIARRDERGHFTRWAALLAFACFTANVVLLSHTFTFQLSSIALVPLTALALLLAYTFRSRLLLLAAILCALLLTTSLGEPLFGYGAIRVAGRPETFMLAAIALWVAPSFVGSGPLGQFESVYRSAALLMALIPMLMMGSIGAGSYLPLAPHHVVRLYQLVGLGTAVLTAWYGLRTGRHYAVIIGVIFCALMLGVIVYDPCCSPPGPPFYAAFLFAGCVVVLTLYAVRLFRRGTQP